ncbi:MAG TPA: thiamine pyrophosphate-dependent dehydrogenase E1 component subunit alpha [Rhizomicrobium sp.]|nr:thiamine pyrophosphate-dependent dehydrogenase E1 component subunit alpha [Rhizomicrobium sp.]
MKRIREFEERVHAEFSRGNIPGFCHLYAGQEASGVGACIHLGDLDWIASTHRGHGHCIAKGCEIDGMMSEIFGKDRGVCRGKGGSMHIADLSKGMLGANAIVGGNPPLVIGAALSNKALRNGKVAVSFTGDGGANQGTTFESMNLAVVLKLPAIFVLENNGYGEGTGFSYHCGAKSLAERAAAFGMPAVTVDGTDFFAVAEAMRDAIARAQAGKGPSAIETICPRFYGHFVGDPQLYRSKAEIEIARKNDPLRKFRERVAEMRIVDLSLLDVIDQEVAQEIEDAVIAASAASWPDIGQLDTDVYVAY